MEDFLVEIKDCLYGWDGLRGGGRAATCFLSIGQRQKSGHIESLSRQDLKQSCMRSVRARESLTSAQSFMSETLRSRGLRSKGVEAEGLEI